MNIVYSFSSNWFDKWKVSCYSLFYHNIEPIKVYILGVELTENQKEDIEDLLKHFNYKHQIILINVPENTFNETNNGEYTKYALYRLLIPELISEDRVLYLDSDTVILKELNSFYYMDFNNNLICGVQDLNVQKEVLKSIDFSSKDIYLNSGVLLFNSKALREEGIHLSMIKAANTKVYTYPDQTILNYFCKDRALSCAPKYNYSFFTKKENLQLEDITILHFAGPKKNEWIVKIQYYHNWKEWRIYWYTNINHNIEI
jgi:lipopolysaccharide biosynthesis glycosyltransferase